MSNSLFSPRKANMNLTLTEIKYTSLFSFLSNIRTRMSNQYRKMHNDIIEKLSQNTTSCLPDHQLCIFLQYQLRLRTFIVLMWLCCYPIFHDFSFFFFFLIRQIATHTMKALLKNQTRQTHKLTPLVHIISAVLFAMKDNTGERHCL